MKRFLCLSTALLFVWPAKAQPVRPELALQIGHMARVTSLASSPDGTLLASGAVDKTAKIWDAKIGALRFSLPHDAAVLAVRFDNNGLLITADAAGTVRAFDTTSGALRGQQEGGQLEMSAAALSRDARLGAFASVGGGIEIREISTGKTLSTLDGHPTRVLSLSFSPDGKTIASSSDAFQEKTESPEIARRAGDVRLWNVADGELIRILRGHALAVRDVEWSSDGTKLASVGESGTAVLWDARNFTELQEFNASQGQGRALSVAFAPDDSRLMVGWRAGVKTFDLKNEQEAVWTVGNEKPVPLVCALPDGRVAAAGDEGTLQFLDGQTGKGSKVYGRTAPLTSVRVTPDGHFLVSADTSGAINIWDGQRGTLERAWQGHSSAVLDIAIAPDGKQLASVGDDGALRLWQLPSGRLQSTPVQSQEKLTSVSFSPDGKIVAFGASEGNATPKVRLWSLAHKEVTATFDEPRGTVYSLAFAPDGSLAAACGNWDSRGEVLVWNSSGKLRLRQVLRGAHAVAISPDGKRLAGAGAYLDDLQDYTSAGDVAQLWSLRAGEITRELNAKAPEARALSAAFGSDSRLLALGSRDGAVRLWNGAASAPTRTLIGHYGAVNGIGISPDGRIVSAGNDGTLKLWDLTTGRNYATLLTLGRAEETKTPPIGTLLSSDWLAITPEGYFNGSAGAGRYVQWRLGADVFPVEAFATGFRQPNAISTALRGEELGKLPLGARFMAGKAVPPQVSILTPRAGQVASEPLTVQISATDDKNLKNIQLLINGRVVASQAVKSGSKPIEVGAKPIEIGAKPLEVGAKPIEVGAKPIEVGAKPIEVGAKPIPVSHDLSWKLSLTAPVPRPDGASGLTLKALVTDADGLQGSEEVRLKRDARESAAGTLRVLSIGVSKYQNPAYNLKYAAADAEAFAKLWGNQGGGLFEKVSVISLSDATANSTAIEAAMGQIARAATPSDVVAVFLSGHGIARGENEFFFASHDVNLDKLEGTAVAWRTFQNLLGASKARRVVLFLDACHSGQALGAHQAGNEEMATQLVKNAGAIVFSSSLGDQHSFELDTLQHGAFTQALIEGIGGAQADLDAGTGKDGVINVEELLTFLRARVPQLTEGAQMPACPLLRDFGEPFPLAKVK